ncbi:MAG TPA: methyltransferase domain-containing protein [Micromonosporaceae bacterium]|nr:methyltransferase domain-containing protein [Micromonosporaceae bacterium]
MIAELLARTGKAVIRDVPPDGRAYWAARFWDRDTHEQHPLLSNAFLQQKETVAGFLGTYAANAERILEFACGTGEFTRLAAERTKAKQITAVDISAEGLRRAGERVRHDNLELVQGDFWTDLGVGDSDVVMCLDAIHHLGDVRQVLQRLRTFVRPGGIFVGNLWTADNFHRFQRQRYGSAAHLRRTAAFLGTALMIRTSGGRLKTGAYRTQLVDSKDAIEILHDVFDTVLAVTVEDYFMGFVCGVGTE